MAGFDMTKKQLIIAMDHARAMGAVPGLVDAGHVIDTVIEAGADGIMTSYGTARAYRERIGGRVPVFLRLDGGPSLVKEGWLENPEWSLLHTLEDAAGLGCEGVCLMYFMGAACELQTMEIVASVASEATAAGLPVMVEALPCPNPNIPNTLDAQMMADACRIAFEHGADILKTYYTGDADGFKKVVDAVPAPVMIAGGPKLDSDLDVLRMVADTVQVGGRGVVFGRNIWQHKNVAGMVKALRAVIHDGIAADEAQRHLDG